MGRDFLKGDFIKWQVTQVGGEAGWSEAASDCLQTPGWGPSQVTFDLEVKNITIILQELVLCKTPALPLFRNVGPQ